MSVVYFSHNIDTEGPLSLEVPSDIKLPSTYPINRTDFKNFDYNSALEKHRSTLLGSWAEINDMLTRGINKNFRARHSDSFGNPWVCNWFCMDHIGFLDNPRNRAMGLHAIFDFYSDLVARQQFGDKIHWHFHPNHRYGEGHRCAVTYNNSPELYTILGRRLFDRNWFPRVNRPGCQDERQDVHWFLEQWIPFDYANAGCDNALLVGNEDFKDGRVSDWRFAPSDWRTYHPHHDCVQIEGNCRRKIAQSASLLNRFAPLTEERLIIAFERASKGTPTLVGLESHDWRDLTLEIEYFFYILNNVKKKFPDVPFRFDNAVDAFNAVHPPKGLPKIRLGCTIYFDEKGLPSKVTVAVEKGKLFGPQPFFVIRTRSRQIVHDSMDFWNSLNDFCYTFHIDFS